MKLYIQLNRDLTWNWIDFSAYRWRSSEPIILYFKTYIYYSTSKIMYNFGMNRGNTPLAGRGPLGGEKIFTVGIFRKNASKYAKLIVEPYICENLNQIYRFFPFIPKNFQIHLVKKSSARKQTDFFRTCVIKFSCFFLLLHYSSII